MDGRPSLAVKGGDSYQKVVSSNPGDVYWMDIFHSKFESSIEKTVNKRKRGRGWPIQKNVD